MNENAGGEGGQQPPFGAPDAFKAIWQGTHPLAAFGTWIDNLLQDPPTPFTMYNEAVKKNGGDPLDQARNRGGGGRPSRRVRGGG